MVEEPATVRRPGIEHRLVPDRTQRFTLDLCLEKRGPLSPVVVSEPSYRKRSLREMRRFVSHAGRAA